MKEKWRYNMRLAGRKGVTVRQGHGQADLDTFYSIYQTTSERDRFFIHEKAHYEDVMRLYSEGDRAALFLAECQGEVIAGILVLRFGRWSWYMYGASSNEQRNLMPNHLLQWSGIQWAKSHDCWYYNFRGIPTCWRRGRNYGASTSSNTVLVDTRSLLETHDLVYQPLVYGAYKRMLDVKRWRDEKKGGKNM